MSDVSKSLIPLEQKTVAFYEDEITAVLVETDHKKEVFVPIRQICDHLGLAFSGQRTHINRDPVLSTATKIVIVTITNAKGGNPNMLCLSLKYLPGWLFGVNANRVKPELREKIIRYQKECYDVLWEAFQDGRLTSDPVFDDLLATDSPAAQAYKTAVAILQIARQQLLLEAQLQAQADQLAQQAGLLSDHERRLELVESTLGHDKRHITPAQASELSQAVKAVAMALGKQTKKNEYGGVYGEMYRRFAIPSYKELPAQRFDEAMKWLNEWLQTLNSTTPF